MSTTRASYEESVFINCPFDSHYKRIYDALVFTVFDCGFIPRSAEEAENIPNRLDRIIQIIKESKFAIHDLSRAGIDRNTRLARFNMPFELGIFFGAHKFGNSSQKQKTFVILDRDKFRYIKFISDLKGYDPKGHDDNPDKAIVNVRDWLNNITRFDLNIQSGTTITDRYKKFRKDLPVFASDVDVNLKVKDLTYNDYCFVVQKWLSQFPAWKWQRGDVSRALGR